MTTLSTTIEQHVRLKQFIKFCIVGGSGVLVDMSVLHCLVKWLGVQVTIGKLVSAETALFSNFILNELWTFRSIGGLSLSARARFQRLWKFQVICGFGIGLAIVLVNVLFNRLRLNLYLANLVAILAGTLWNFWLNALLNWRVKTQNVSSPMGLWDELPY